VSDDDPTLVRHVRAALKRERYPDDRRVPPKVNWLAYLPLAAAVLAGVTGYVRTQAKVEELERNQSRIERTITKELDQAEETHAAMWRRITE
jgi:hypothetical protein